MEITQNIVSISLVVPFYNEEESIDIFFETIIPILQNVNLQFEIICINDGSNDDTLFHLLEKKKIVPQIHIINFSRNFGKDAALTAGIDFAHGKCLIPIDCDLQDPPELIIEMIKKWQSGADVVVAKRVDRSSDECIKKITASAFYKIYNYISELKLPENVGDFRLIDRKVIEVLKQFTERQRFMKGLFSFAGFNVECVEYSRPLRARGITKWNYWKLWNYAIDGITSFSTFPLKISTYFGLTVTALAFLRGLFIIFNSIFNGIDVPGYASLMIAVLFFGGVQLISLGIIGEYIGRIYLETKQRPIYIVKDIF